MRDPRWRRILVAAGAVSLVGLPGIGVAGEPEVSTATDYSFEQVEFGDQTVSPERLTASKQMTKDELAPTRAFGGPTSMLADSDDPNVIVAATANLRTRVCHLVRSTDAGDTWQIVDALPAPEDFPYCTSSNAGVAQASIAWGGDGTLYYGMLGYGEGEGGRNQQVSVILARSNDLGDTWETTVVDNNRGKTGVAPSASGVTDLAVDTSGPEDVVYVAYSHGYRNAPEDSPLNDSPIFVGVSKDGGKTFEPQINLNDSIDLTQDIAGQEYPLIMSTSFGRPFLAAHDGVVLAVSDSRTLTSQSPPGEDYYAMPMLVARSTDQGETWSTTKLSPPIFTGTGAQTGMGWTSEGGPDGTFVAAYAATPETAKSSGLADIVVQRSTDGGETWSEPSAIDDDDPAERFTSFYPQLGVAPNGRIDVAWQDNRQQSDFRYQVRYTYSTDGGETWADNVQVTDEPLNFALGVSYNSDVRQPPGVASADQYAAFGWADARLADDVNQTQDAFGSIAQFSDLPGDSSALPVVAAVLGGLVVVGLVLLVLALLKRRQGGPAPAEPAAPAAA